MVKANHIFACILLFTSFAAAADVGPSALVAARSALLSGDHTGLGRLLADNPGILEQPDGNGQRLLHLAAQSGHSAGLAVVLAAQPNLAAIDGDGATALHLAAGLDRGDAVSALLAAGAPVTLFDRSGWSVLHAAAASGALEAMRRLLDRGVSPRIADRDGVSALHVAVVCNQAAAVGLLLERGAPVDATSAVLSTPLHLAAAVENVDIARTLIAKGARTSVMDQRGLTPWERAPERSKAAFAALGCAPAAEHGPTITAAVSVLRVISGEEVEIAAQAGGRTVGVRVRLIWLRSPDPKDGTALGWEDPSTAALTALLPAGSQIRLWSPGPFFPLDTRGRTLALVLMGAEGEDSAQERLVGAGMAAYWRRYGAAPEPWHSRLSQAQQRAAQAQAGAWARITPWMRMQADEEQSIR